MITVEMHEDRINLGSEEAFWWRASCLCGWFEDSGWQSDALELAREHESEADCDW